ncbi:MAG: hypothetical protein K2I36_00405, partial [Ureaplasma sp.]|nr:hypothetical protein [Ureaplasma sp.]MDE7221842.1 hypothetical protein [Ureaplasma sp.]
MSSQKVLTPALGEIVLSNIKNISITFVGNNFQSMTKLQEVDLTNFDPTDQSFTEKLKVTFKTLPDSFLKTVQHWHQLITQNQSPQFQPIFSKVV